MRKNHAISSATQRTTVRNRKLAVIALGFLAAGTTHEIPVSNGHLIQVAATTQRGAGAVSGRPTKFGSVTGKGQPTGAVNGGKR